MTPEEARRSIREAEDLRSNLPADCWRALETIAGMHEEWGVVWPADNASPEWTAWGFHSAEEACEHITSMSVPDKPSPDTRIVRRYVTTPEEA